ncbi:hypothetical protein, partial [Vibrio parahaemolyticus]
MKLIDIEINGKSYNLTSDKLIGNSNEYTLLLGENGSGKSEIIREVINILLRMKVSEDHNVKHN